MENDSKREIFLYKCFVGVTYGLSFPLTLVVLDYWLKSLGVSNTTIGMFSLLQWPFALKFIWGFFIEHCDIPLLSDKYGRHRSWMICSYVILIAAILGMAFSRPEHGLIRLVFFASVVVLADGCKNVAMYPYQVHKCEKDNLGYIASIVGLGHRAGMLFIKVVTLYIAGLYNWEAAYIVAAVLVGISFAITLFLEEPTCAENKNEKLLDALKSCFTLKGISHSTILILFFYKVSDFMMQKMSRAFCVEIGFTPIQIANIVQIFGTSAVILGTFIGGYIVKRYSIYRAMLIVGVAHMLSMLSYVPLALFGNNLRILTLVSVCDGFTGGAVTTAFIAFLYSVSRNGTLYALFWAIHGCSGMLFMMLSGFIADNVPWLVYFSVVPFFAIPGLYIIWTGAKNKKLA